MFYIKCYFQIKCLSISTVIFLHQNVRLLYLVTLHIFISSLLCITSSVPHFYKSSFACVLCVDSAFAVPDVSKGRAFVVGKI